METKSKNSTEVECAALERLLRYCARPPFALERLEAIDDEHLRYHSSKPQADGTTELQLTPLELIDRIAALVPPRVFHLLPFPLYFLMRFSCRYKAV